jgi:hypothetical protein
LWPRRERVWVGEEGGVRGRDWAVAVLRRDAVDVVVWQGMNREGKRMGR